MKFNTLNTIVDDIMLTYRNSNIGESESLNRAQIEQWVHNYRAFLIKQDIDKGKDVNPEYIQYLNNVHLDVVEVEPGYYKYVTEMEIPKTINFNYSSGIISIEDMYGNPIQLGTQTKQKYQRYRKYTCQDYIAYFRDDKIYVEGNSNQLEYINIGIIAEDPTSLIDCFSGDDAYPVPANMVNTIIDLIFDHKLNIMSQVTSDVTNDSADDNQNVPKR